MQINVRNQMEKYKKEKDQLGSNTVGRDLVICKWNRYQLCGTVLGKKGIFKLHQSNKIETIFLKFALLLSLEDWILNLRTKFSQIHSSTSEKCIPVIGNTFFLPNLLTCLSSYINIHYRSIVNHCLKICPWMFRKKTTL